MNVLQHVPTIVQVAVIVHAAHVNVLQGGQKRLIVVAKILLILEILALMEFTIAQQVYAILFVLVIIVH